MADWTSGGRKDWSTSSSSGSLTRRREKDDEERLKMWEKDEEKRNRLSEEERKMVEAYNNPKNEEAFKKSREVFNKILQDPNNKDYQKALKLAPHIRQDEKEVNFTENGFSRLARNAGQFAEESNKAFFGGIGESAANAVNFVGSGGNTQEMDKRTKDFMRDSGMRDERGLTSLEKLGRTDEQINQEVKRNEEDEWAKKGRGFGEAQRIAADIATTVIPGAAAEKLLRGTSAMAKLGQGGRLARTAGDVISNVGGGAAATAVGGIKDPTSLTAQNVGTNVAIDAGFGLAGGALSTIASKVRTARNTKELSKALTEVDTSALPKKYADKLNKLQVSSVKGSAFQEQVNEIMDEARHAKKFEVLSDGATAKNTTIKTRLDDIDRRLTEVDTPEYQANNGLLKTDEAQAKYDEMMADVSKLPGVPEANAQIEEATRQLEYYDGLRLSSPYAKKVDKIRARIDQIEQARQADIEGLGTMASDDVSEFDGTAFRSLSDDANRRYDDMIKAEQAKIDELAASNPEDAAQLEMLDQATQTIKSQQMDAQQALDDVMSQQVKVAEEEAAKIAQMPNEEAIQQHKALLQEKQARLNKRYEDATKRFEAPNQKLADVDEELMYMQDGTHPLVADGASKEKQFRRYVELNKERARLQAKDISTSHPDIPKTEAEKALVLDEALEEVATAKPSRAAAIGRVWSQPANLLRTAGFNKLADLRTDAIIRHNRQAYDIKMTMREWGKQSKGNSTKDLFRAANGDAAAMERLTPGGRIVIEQWQKQAYEMGKAMGLPEEVLKRGDYIPHLFTDIRKNPRLLDLTQRASNLRKEIAAGGLDEKALAKKSKQLEQVDESIKAIKDNPGIVTADDFIKETGEFSNRFLKERYNAEGYEEDFWKATDAYMNAANTKVNLEPVMEEFARAKGLTPEKNMQKFLQTEIDKMRGTKSDIDRGLDDFFNTLTNSTSTDMKGNLGTKSLRGFRSAMSLSHIGFSATSAVNTLAQASIMPGSLNIDGSLYGLYKAGELTGKLARNTLTRSETEIFDKMARMGAFEGSSHILPEQTTSKYFNKFSKAAYSGITGSDRYLRMATYFGAEMKATRMGLRGADAERYIYERINEVNQNFSKLEAPHAFKSQVAKSLGSMVTFVPGMVVRSVEIGGKSIKGGADIIGHTIKGQPITRAEFLKDVDDISKGVFTVMGVWTMGNVIGNVTGQDEIIPNPLNAQTYNSPMLQFIFGSQYKTGVIGAFTNQSGDKYDENGNNLTRAERTNEFWTELIPSFLVPGYSQGKRTAEGLKANEQGFSETDNGNIRYKTDPQYDLQRSVFGQYSTPEGKEYIDNMGRPGGGALTESESEKVKNAPVNLQDQYYQFFKATDRITGRTEANSEVTRLFREGRPEAARRKAEEYNSKVDQKLADFFSKYPDIDDELEDELRSNVKITLTDRSESARTRD